MVPYMECIINTKGAMGNCSELDQVQQVRWGRVAEITNYTWSKQYLGLFDYQTKSVSKCEMVFHRSGKVEKEQDELRQVQRTSPNNLFRLLCFDNYYQLLPAEHVEGMKKGPKKIWLVVNSLPSKSYQLRERDQLKFGKEVIHVRQIVCAEEKLQPPKEIRVSKIAYESLQYKEETNVVNEINETESVQIDNHTQENQIQCRICLEEGTVVNPLIRACKCTGTIGYLHLSCLKSWLSKLIKPTITSHCVTLVWKPLCCEMCNTKYNYRIYLDNQLFYTVDIPRPQRPYVVLETTCNKVKVFKFITFAHKEQIKLGRKKDTDVKISDDISVSRVHASLCYNKHSKQIHLIDHDSKFGTVVLAKRGIILRPRHHYISTQIGAEVYEFQVMREQSEVKAENYQDAKDDILMENCSQWEQGSEEEESQEQYSLKLDQEDQRELLQRSPIAPQT